MASTSTVDLGFDQARLEAVIGAVAAKPEVGRTVWKARSTWQHGFRSEATIREFSLAMDEPTSIGGSDTAPNMVEVVLGAYGSCLITGYVLNAARRGIRLNRVEVELEGDLDLRGFFDLDAAVWPGYTTVRATTHLAADGVPEERLRALHADTVRTSPVGSILARPVGVEHALHVQV